MQILINGTPCATEKGEVLSHVLLRNGFTLSHPCGGKGTCGKCLVKIDGKEEKSCQYIISAPISVEVPEEKPIESDIGLKVDESQATDNELVLDIGTTTLALALVSPGQRKILKTQTANNPQRVFGADVISRIEYAASHGVSLLTDAIRNRVLQMITEIGGENATVLHVAGNTTMLHLFLGINPSPIGVTPYTPAFLEEKWIKTPLLPNITTIHTLPGISAFVGADLVAGINLVDLPKKKHRLLVDLGTNAEIILFSREKIYATAAAAGPCFEGTNISCGRPAVPGAIFSYHNGTFQTIGNIAPIGLCGTGLLDVMAYLLSHGIVDETGYMEEDFRITQNISLTREDVRQYQLAKSAIYSGITTLINEQGLTFDDIDQLYISGGFASKINLENAISTGLIPAELKERCIPIGNSSLLGTVKWVFEKNNLSAIPEKATYVDLAKSKTFSDSYMANMIFQ